MALNEETKVDFSFKILNNKTETSTKKQVYEELRSSSFTIHKNNIWVDDIPSDPQEAVNAGVAVKYELFVLTEDLTVENHKGWYASENGEYLTDWIPPSFGQGYNVRLYDANGNEITTADPIDWFFQYNPGYLFIQNQHSYPTPFKITGYVYIGKKLEGSGSASATWKSPVDSESDLPLTGNSQGDVRLTLNENKLFRWSSDTSEWLPLSNDFWVEPVDTYADLPASGKDGSIIYVKDTSDNTYGNRIYRWNSATNSWIMVMPGTHFHDDRYFTKDQLAPDASVGNNVLDDRYYTEDELLNGALDIRYPTHSDVNTYFDKDMGHRHTGVDGDGPRISYNDLIDVPTLGDFHWQAPVQSFDDLPSSGNNEGDVRLTLDTVDIYAWKDDAWEVLSTGIEKWKTPVNTYQDLPLTGNSQGDIRLVLSENILYRWDSTQAEWIAIWGHSFALWEEDFELSDGQTIVTLSSHTYKPNQHEIMVYFNGVLGQTGKDYFETNENTITLAAVGEIGDRVTVIGKSSTSSPSTGVGYYSWREPVDDFSDLPLSNNHDADTRLVKSENVIYRWNEAEFTWQSITAIQWQERFNLVNGQREVNLTHSYEVGQDEIMVYINGVLGTVNEDYYEVSGTKIRLELVGEDGDKVTVVGKSASGGYQPKHTYEEKIATQQEADNDEVYTNSVLLPVNPENQLIAPDYLRANNILLDVIVNGQELYDDEYRYYYDTNLSKKIIKFSGTGFGGYDIQQNDKIKIKVIKL